jgi:5-methyltetrahydrofolate--homocysteine methyltransferase
MTLREKLQKETILLDGAFGTYVQSLGLKDSDFQGKTGCMEYLSIASPDLLLRIHKDYLEAGSDAIETNTFGANAVKLSEYGLSKDVFEINKISTELARGVADSFASQDRPRYVIGGIGPTGKLPSSTDPVLGDITYKELKSMFSIQASGIIAGGADAMLIETGQDILEMKAAVNGVRDALADSGKEIPIIAQCTLANDGRMLLGTEISAVMAILWNLNVDVIGLNCGAGPLQMEEQVRYLSEVCPAYISCLPNAGLPQEVNGETHYSMDSAVMGEIMMRFVSKYGVNIIGGCCGTTPEHIRVMRNQLDKLPSRYKKLSGKKLLRKQKKANLFCASSYVGYDLSAIDKPVKVGERVNTQGSRKMKDMLLNEDYDGIVELGKKQEAMGSDLLDVCSALTERDTEVRDEVILVKRLAESVKVPLMIDSVDVDVVQEALCNYPGTAFINSVNLEDGGERAENIFALAKEHGSFVVCLAIDSDGMAISSQKKIDIAKKLHDIACRKHGLAPHQLLFDMLTFSLATGDEEYATSAMETIKAIKIVKKCLPGVLTVLGVSNVSFGLSKEGRRVLNAAFLHHTVKSGLDMAIVNPAQDFQYLNFSNSVKKIADNLILNRGNDPLNAFVEYFSDKSIAEKKPGVVSGGQTSIVNRLKECVMDRNKAAIIPLIDEALGSYKAEEIINEILLEAMKDVGNKLESGEFVLPYVLQAAEVMRKAMEYLSGMISKENAPIKKKVLLATVLGDVHDIGKNLVKMILENNGYSIIDLGKQVPAQKIAAEAKKNKVDAIGLSALLVSTARYMRQCVQAIHDAGLDCPILIGGSPTNDNFAKEISILKDKSIYKGGVLYTRDAFSALKVLQSPVSEVQGTPQPVVDEKRRCECSCDCGKVPKKSDSEKAKTVVQVPEPPFYGVRAILDIPAGDIFDRLDENMLFNVGWGTKLKDKRAKEELIEKEYKPLLKRLKAESLREGWLDFKVVYGYFKCRLTGGNLSVMDTDNNVIEVISFNDLPGKKGIAGYFCSSDGGEDVVAFMAATVGEKISDKIAQFGDEQEYSETFFVHGLSVYLAEALAEYMHDRVRTELKIKKGQGKRYSPGYPAWKNLEDQKKIFKLLNVEKAIGIKLTEAFQMIPEQSITAIIVHSELAEY